MITIFEPPYNITLSSDPFDDVLEIGISTHGVHPTLGLELHSNDEIGERLQLENCAKSTPAARIPRWRSTLRHSFPIAIVTTAVHTVQDIKNAVKSARINNESTINCKFGVMKKVAMHPQTGVPIIFHDQLNVISQHLATIKLDHEANNEKHKRYLDAILPTVHAVKSKKKRAKLTRRILKQQQDWHEWLLSEHKQLQQYEDQGMFGTPTMIPDDANSLPFIWTYIVKECGTKMARGVCNGSPRMKGTVTLGETYAASLDQTCAKIFWAINAEEGNIVVGADVSNAFAEAPAPCAPLYMTLDSQFHTWWKSLGRQPIPEGYGVKIHKAMQGHPESPRLWARMINKIITDLGFTACKHEPCLYFHPNYKGKPIYFIRQVDDFAIGCRDRAIADDIINIIDGKMTIKLKPLGIISRFNGIDVTQTRDYIKISNTTYFSKILEDKLQPTTPSHTYPIPMNSDPAYNRRIEEAVPLTDKELQKAEKKFGFSYRQGIGELIYGMVTCRPDISFPLIKLSQYSTKPALEHFEAVQELYNYIRSTKSDGIYYWRTTPRMDLPLGPLPETKEDKNYTPQTREQYDRLNTRASVDSDYANDTTHRRSVSGIAIKLAGGTIFYKTAFQVTVALTSTEAEFIAACEAAKIILYIRSILDDINVKQDTATTLYEDNQGALLMANSGQPTKRTRHMDTKHFALQQWVDLDLLTLKRIATADNESDGMTKNLGRTLFYRHMEYLMGKIIPEYVTYNT